MHNNRSMEDSTKHTQELDPPKQLDSPSLQQLENILHGAQASSHHGDEVWPGLYLGDRVMSQDRYTLWRLGITHVLNASHGRGSQDDFYGTTVQYLGVNADDLPTFDISPFFYPSAQFIHQALSTAGGKVFVHCAVGVSRSATLVLAYLMIHHGFSVVQAILKVQESRCIYPNRGFLQQLLHLDSDLKNQRRLTHTLKIKELPK